MQLEGIHRQFTKHYRGWYCEFCGSLVALPGADISKVNKECEMHPPIRDHGMPQSNVRVSPTRVSKPRNSAKVMEVGKPDLSLVPRSLLDSAARGFEAGLAGGKYERNDWKKGMKLSRCMASLLRHCHDLNDGIVIDADSGEKNLSLIAARVAMLCEYFDKGTGDHDLVESF